MRYEIEVQGDGSLMVTWSVDREAGSPGGSGDPALDALDEALHHPEDEYDSHVLDQAQREAAYWRREAARVTKVLDNERLLSRALTNQRDDGKREITHLRDLLNNERSVCQDMMRQRDEAVEQRDDAMDDVMLRAAHAELQRVRGLLDERNQALDDVTRQRDEAMAREAIAEVTLVEEEEVEEGEEVKAPDPALKGVHRVDAQYFIDGERVGAQSTVLLGEGAVWAVRDLIHALSTEATAGRSRGIAEATRGTAGGR